jgi:imidazolonepropionase
MKCLITNIAQLINTRTSVKLLRGKDLAELPVIDDAFLALENGIIKDFGRMDQISNIKDDLYANFDIVDAQRATILPTWCDSHTHLVFAASREDEFVDKMKT